MNEKYFSILCSKFIIALITNYIERNDLWNTWITAQFAMVILLKKKCGEILSGGNNTAFLKIKVGVCLHCGERLYTPDMINRFEEIEAKLSHQETTGFQQLGQSYEVAF